MRRLASAALLALVPAGCASDAPPLVPRQLPAPNGVVVDEAVRPIAGALVEVSDTGQAATTDDGGAFAITEVAPGLHIVRASHGLDSTTQQAVSFLAGDANPF